jgi:hypothetical protein
MGVTMLGRRALQMAGREVAERSASEIARRSLIKAGAGAAATSLTGGDEISPDGAWFDSVEPAAVRADIDGDGDIDTDDGRHLAIAQQMGFEGQVTKGEGIGEINVNVMDMNGDGKVGRGEKIDVTVPLNEQQAHRRDRGEVWAGYGTDVEAASMTNAGTDYIENVRKATHENAGADFDADGDIDKTDARHERHIRDDLGFKGQIEHDRSGRPILSAMDLDSDAGSISFDTRVSDYINDISADGREHGGWAL